MIPRTAQGRIGHYLAKEKLTRQECLVQDFGLGREDGERLVSFGAVYIDRQRVAGIEPWRRKSTSACYFTPRRYPVDKIEFLASDVRGAGAPVGREIFTDLDPFEKFKILHVA